MASTTPKIRSALRPGNPPKMLAHSARRAPSTGSDRHCCHRNLRASCCLRACSRADLGELIYRRGAMAIPSIRLPDAPRRRRSDPTMFVSFGGRLRATSPPHGAVRSEGQAGRTAVWPSGRKVRATARRTTQPSTESASSARSTCVTPPVPRSKSTPAIRHGCRSSSVSSMRQRIANELSTDLSPARTVVVTRSSM